MFDNIVVFTFLAFSVILVFFVVRVLVRKIGIFAKPPINPIAFIAAKICAFSSCVCIPSGMLWPELKWFSFPEWLRYIALAPLFSGICIAIIAMKKLDDDLVFGLPEDGIKSLKTGGIFGISRNPLYLGFILIIVASCMLTANPVNWGAAFIAVALHHLIVLREEEYLKSRLGNEYLAYMKQTGRYLFVF